MTFVPMTPSLGYAPIASTKAALATMFAGGRSPGPELGDIIRAVDPVYGVGEFIYLLGVASTVVGSVVTYGGGGAAPTWQTALAPATANLAQPLAVAMSINLATFYGWYQISGMAVCATNGTLAAGPGPVYLAGSGQLSSSAVAGKQVENAINISATGTPSTGLAIVEINRPFAQGAIT
jgi:hypothetical protein